MTTNLILWLGSFRIISRWYQTTNSVFFSHLAGRNKQEQGCEIISAWEIKNFNKLCPEKNGCSYGHFWQSEFHYCASKKRWSWRRLHDISWIKYMPLSSPTTRFLQQSIKLIFLLVLTWQIDGFHSNVQLRPWNRKFSSCSRPKFTILLHLDSCLWVLGLLSVHADKQ